MNILTRSRYYQKLSKLQEDYINESPCDPDITDEQIIAYKRLNQFKKNNIPEVDLK